MRNNSSHDNRYDDIVFVWPDGTKCQILFYQYKLRTVFVDFGKHGKYTIAKDLFFAVAKEERSQDG